MNAREIIRLCEQAFGVPAGSARAETRKREVVDARALASLLLWEHKAWSYARIGTVLGGRHYSSILNLRKRAQDLIDVDADYAERFREVEHVVKSHYDPPEWCPPFPYETQPKSAFFRGVIVSALKREDVAA